MTDLRLTEQFPRRSSAAIDEHRGSPRCPPDVNITSNPTKLLTIDFKNGYPQLHDRPLPHEVMRANGLSPKPVDWRQPEPLSFYASGPGGLLQHNNVHGCIHLRSAG